MLLFIERAVRIEIEIIFTNGTIVFIIFALLRKILDLHFVLRYHFLHLFLFLVQHISIVLLYLYYKYLYQLAEFREFLYLLIVLIDYPLQRNDSCCFLPVFSLLLPSLHHPVYGVWRHEVYSLADIKALGKAAVVSLDKMRDTLKKVQMKSLGR